MISLTRAIEIAAHVHKDQKDKAGASYILHPLRVMMKVSDLGEDGMIIGVLHDTIEDMSTAVTPESVRFGIERLEWEGLTESQINSLTLLTHLDDVSYAEYIEGIATDQVATRVKIADLEDNMDIKRIKNRRALTEKDMQRLQKYLNAWTRLTGK